jgi:hypothetical protein
MVTDDEERQVVPVLGIGQARPKIGQDRGGMRAEVGLPVRIDAGALRGYHGGKEESP